MEKKILGCNATVPWRYAVILIGLITLLLQGQKYLQKMTRTENKERSKHRKYTEVRRVRVNNLDLNEKYAVMLNVLKLRPYSVSPSIAGGAVNALVITQSMSLVLWYKVNVLCKTKL